MASKTSIVPELHAAKRNSGKTYGQIADRIGLTNVYVAQLLRRQAQLKPDTAPLLRAALPDLTENHIREMMQPPMRSYDPHLIQEPTVYRLNEAIMHFGESIKEIINEDFGDGIMSAIDFYCSVDKIKGVDGKDRVVVTFDGKYLPYTEQSTAHMVSRLRKQDNQLNEDCTSAQTTNPINAPNFQCAPNVQGPPNFQPHQDPPNFQPHPNFQHPKSQCPPHLQAPPNIQAMLNPYIPVCYNPFMGSGNPTTPTESQRDRIRESEITQFPTQQQLKNIVITNEVTDEKRVKWSIEEDKMLTNAWLVISNNSVKGNNNQHDNGFWRRIGKYFNKHRKTGTQRKSAVLKSHWYKMAPLVNEFNQFFIQMKERHSGWSDDQVKEAALDLYCLTRKKHFNYHHVWKIVKDESKWKVGKSSEYSSKRTKISESGEYASSPDAPPSINIDNNEVEVHTVGGDKEERKSENHREKLN